MLAAMPAMRQLDVLASHGFTGKVNAGSNPRLASWLMTVESTVDLWGHRPQVQLLQSLQPHLLRHLHLHRQHPHHQDALFSCLAILGVIMDHPTERCKIHSSDTMLMVMSVPRRKVTPLHAGGHKTHRRWSKP